MAQESFRYIRVTGAGTTTINIGEGIPHLIYVYASGAVVLGGDYTLEFSALPPVGTVIKVPFTLNTVDLNGNSLNIFGYSLNALQLANDGYYEFEVCDDHSGSPGIKYNYAPYDFKQSDIVAGTILTDASLTLAKFPALTRGYIWRGDATGRPALYDANGNAQILIGDGTDLNSVAVTGDIAITNAGVTSIAAGAIVNADVNASAAIAFSKLATLSSGNILVGSAGNVATSVAMSGDVAIDNAGATTIQANAVENSMIADDAVTLTNLASTGQVYSYATTTATAANTTETALASFAMGSAIGDADGDVLEVYAYGSFGATANNKSVRLRFGATLATATQLCINTTTAAPNGINWVVKAKIFRTGAASQKGQAEILFSGIAAELDNFTATETWATSTIYLSGQNGTAAANDIVLEGFEVKIGRTNNN